MQKLLLLLPMFLASCVATLPTPSTGPSARKKAPQKETVAERFDHLRQEVKGNMKKAWKPVAKRFRDWGVTGQQ